MHNPASHGQPVANICTRCWRWNQQAFKHSQQISRITAFGRRFCFPTWLSNFDERWRMASRHLFVGLHVSSAGANDSCDRGSGNQCLWKVCPMDHGATDFRWGSDVDAAGCRVASWQQLSQITPVTGVPNTQMIQCWMICGSWGRALAALPIVPSPCARYNAAIAACEKGSCWEAALTFMRRRGLDGNNGD